jgi:hypothetical protein
MALYNEILAGRFNRALQKFLGMKGSAPSPQLANEITTGFQFPLGAEFRYLESWNRFGVAIAVAAAAANQGCFRFRNPLTSNVIAVIEKLSIAENALDNNAVLRLGQTTTDLVSVTGTSGCRFDARGLQAATCVISSQNTTVGAPAIGGNENSVGVFQVLAGTQYDIVFSDIQEIPCLPGDAYQVNCGVVNQRITASLWWRERLLEEGERF